MSSTEFVDWKTFYLLEPFGTAREDERAGVVAATVANVFRKKNTAPHKPSSFFPPYLKRKNTNTWQEQLELVEALNQMLGGKDIRAEKQEAV